MKFIFHKAQRPPSSFQIYCSAIIAPYNTIIATENLDDVWEIFTGGKVKRLPFCCLLLIKYMSTLDRFDTSVKGHKLNSNSLSLLEIPHNIRYFK